jgi:hypothetical protein
VRPASRKPLLLACAGLTMACESALGPKDIEGTYVLRDVAGSALPAIVDSNSHGFVRVLADTLYFAPDGHGTRTEIVEGGPADGGAPTGPIRWERSFGFGVVHGWIEVTFDCAPDALCAAPPHLVARPIANGLKVEFALTSRVPQTYTGPTSAP